MAMLKFSISYKENIIQIFINHFKIQFGIDASVKLSQNLRIIQCIFCAMPALKNSSVATAMQRFFAST
ncbi:hypothetical protein MNBD_BACTEROID03-2785 [hydrothermal vent metagenome]|uniref:Uncharacterized protein n=1 Tax=hydrothermal vent metagenome TaxID=652676 RepID=A0A3B0TM53_9ZZZZ